ncbi:hypothetical protein GCM10027059_26340 [Myceligenerans halotolerans]
MAQPIEHEKTQLHWTIAGIHLTPLDAESDSSREPLKERHPDWAILGELFAHSTDGAVAVTSEIILNYRNVEDALSLADEGRRRDELDRLADELQHLLYDSAANFARMLKNSIDLDVEVPIVTPELSVHMADTSDADAPEPEPESEHA